MGVIDSLKEMFVPDTRDAVQLECTECGATFDTARDRCPECGSTETKEVGGFDMRPDD